MAGLQEKDTISLSDAKAMLAEKRSSQPAQPTVSEAASVMAQARAAKAAAAQAASQAANKPQPNQPQGSAQPNNPEEEDEADENAQAGAEGENVAGEQSDLEQAATEDETGDEPIIEVDGKTYTAQEIRDSYLRRDDYTRKTQEVAQQKSLLDQRAQNLEQRETQSLKQLDALIAMATNLIGQEPNWAEVAQKVDPQTYNQMRAQWEMTQRTFGTLLTERQQTEIKSLQMAKNAMWEELTRDYKPEWKDQTKLDADTRTLAQFAVSQGVTPQELQYVSRAPYMKILDMAHKWAESQKNVNIANKKVIGKPKPLRPGMQRGRIDAETQAYQTAKSEWENNPNPSHKDAARWMQAKRQYNAAKGGRV